MQRKAKVSRGRVSVLVSPLESALYAHLCTRRSCRRYHLVLLCAYATLRLDPHPLCAPTPALPSLSIAVGGGRLRESIIRRNPDTEILNPSSSSPVRTDGRKDGWGSASGPHFPQRGSLSRATEARSAGPRRRRRSHRVLGAQRPHMAIN